MILLKSFNSSKPHKKVILLCKSKNVDTWCLRFSVGHKSAGTFSAWIVAKLEHSENVAQRCGNTREASLGIITKMRGWIKAIYKSCCPPPPWKIVFSLHSLFSSPYIPETALTLPNLRHLRWDYFTFIKFCFLTFVFFLLRSSYVIFVLHTST